MELVSIVVPVYNVEKYLRECIDSLVHQSYKNIEIILVDDGSKDSSGEICDNAATEDARIKVIHKENAGLGYARNTGIQAASGKYVTFIDSDDFADVDLVEKLMDGITNGEMDTCIGGFKRISEAGGVQYTEAYAPETYYGEAVYQRLFARMLGSAPDKSDAVRMSVWNVMYSMKIIRENNLRFPSEREYISEDIIWDSEYYKYSKKVRIINSTAYNYRITPGSLTQKYKPKMFEQVCILYQELYSRISGNTTMIQRLRRQFFVNLRTCISQEKRQLSGLNITDRYTKILAIMNDPLVQEAVKGYPVNQMQFKQRFFLLLLRNRCVNLMIWFADHGIV